MTGLRTAGRTDKGRIRNNNEDHFFIGVIQKSLSVVDTNLEVTEAVTEMTQLDADLLVVADGVGGSVGGERASRSAVFTLATYIARSAACHYDPDVEQEEEFLQRLGRAVEAAHVAVKGLSTGGRGPATTVTLAIVIGSRAYIAHAGDSRAYHFRRGRLRLVTRDQTWANLLADAGVDDENASRGNFSNVLASAVGSQSLTPSIGLVDISPGDWLLLCTDGLTKHVSDEAISSLLAGTDDPAAACDRLMTEALNGGGTDNVTIVAARVPD